MANTATKKRTTKSGLFNSQRLPTEKAVINRLKQINRNFKDLQGTSKYSRCDAYNDKAIVEIKNRTKAQSHYEDAMIERKKANFLFTNAMNSGRDFYYVCYRASDKQLYCWNVSRLAREKYSFGWRTMKCRKNNQGYTYIDKEVGGLRWEDAHKVVPFLPSDTF